MARLVGISFEQFFRAIAQQESGGSYSAVGPATAYGHAYGKYQVLAPNIGPWTQQYYGKRLTAQQFLANHQAQEMVAYGKLKDYWDKYGARGAASAWYSGNPDLHMSTSSQSGGPSIKEYVDDVLAIAENKSSDPIKGMGGSGGSGSGGGGGGSEVEPMTISEQAESYGLSLRLVNSNNELKKLFNKAVSGSWSATRFQAALRNTKWWRTQSNTEREYITLRYTDPATWSQDRKNAAAELKALAIAVGLKDFDGELMGNAIYNKLANGWSDARLKNWLGSKVRPFDGQFRGEAGETQDALVELAYMNGVGYSGSRMRNWIQDIMAGKTTAVAVENRMRKDAAAKYGAYRSQIMAGMNVIDLAAPYISAVSTILELPETDIDLGNKWVRDAMTAKGSSGSQYPMWKFEVDLRSDPKWRQTSNARESIMTTAHQVAKDFGVAF